NAFLQAVLTRSTVFSKTHVRLTVLAGQTKQQQYVVVYPSFFDSSNCYLLLLISFVTTLSIVLSPSTTIGRNLGAMATFAARQAASAIARISSSRPSSQAASLVHRRGLAGAADHHGPPKVNFWQDPMSPSKWKEEHFVIVSLSGWGLLIFGGYKFFTRGKGNKEEKLVEAAH
ncbi:1D-myo-inositol 2-amino-2-deoxy-alpha-D-glucopyranoside ligase, partial [Melia azedarach]